MKTEIIQIENLQCSGCVSSIKDGLNKIEGVSAVEVNREEETVRVLCDDNIDSSLLLEKLSQMGYPEKGHNTSFAKVKSYVSCAIGKLKE